MLKIKKPFYWVTALVAIVTVLFFQNCSQVAFDSGSAAGGSMSPVVISGDNPAPTIPGDTEEPGYSETCEDYYVAGFPSKGECLKDGRWHYISTTELEIHMYAGVGVKVVIPRQEMFLAGQRLNAMSMGASEECQQVYRSQYGSRPIYCLTTIRFQGEHTQETDQGSARYGTDGSLYCNGVNRPGSNGCNVDPMTFKWYIRY